MKALALLLVLCACASVAQTATPLHNGQSITLRGTLQMGPQGRLQFATVRTKQAYVPLLQAKHGKDRRGEAMHEVALSGYHHYDLLYAHRGEAVTVTGKVMTDDASPYYYKNTSILASSIRLQDGSDLLGEPRLQEVAAGVTHLAVTVTLPADLSAPWGYEGAGFDGTHRPVACSSNGGGDVVNCYCPLNFRAANAVMLSGGKQHGGELMGQMAQFQVGEVDRPSTITLGMSCDR